MKTLITTILLITLISCTSNPAPTEEVVVKKDSVIVVDTVARKEVFKTSARVAVLSDEVTISKAELGHLIDSIAAWKVASTQGQDYITMRKDLGFVIDEIDRLTSENVTKNEIIMALQDSLNKFHYVTFPDFFTIVGEKVDTVYSTRP